MIAEELIRDFSKVLLNWYPFKKSDKILYVYSQEGIWEEALFQRRLDVDMIELQQLHAYVEAHIGSYSIVVAIRAIEKAEEKIQFLQDARQLLNAEGKLLLGVENRLGIKNFCGERDPYTNGIFDGIENYKKALDTEKSKKGRLFAKNEIIELLEEAGWTDYQFYSVLPGLETPQLIYAEDYLPEENLAVRFFPIYHHPETVFIEEERLYESLIKNGLFHILANSFFVECVKNNHFCEIKHMTASVNRGREKAMLTILYKDHVEKRPIYEEGMRSLQKLSVHSEELRQRGIHTVDGVLEKNRYVMPYMHGEIGICYFERLLRTNIELFLQELDRFREILLKSSEPVEMEDLNDRTGKERAGRLLKKGYFDLVPINCFVIEGEFVFFDQEFCIENYPANALIYRTIDLLYISAPDLNMVYPKEKLWKRYNMEDQIVYLSDLVHDFTVELRNEKELRLFNEHHALNRENAHSNRQRMNFPAIEYQRLFINIFDGLDRKKLVLFGSGNFTKKFLALYGKEYRPVMILDNNPDKWGSDVEGILICSPEEFFKGNTDEYKVLICIKNYLSVFRQLQEASVRNIGIYDTNMEYVNVKKPVKFVEKGEASQELPKKYRVGYIAGVFDLFHIGHLNMFKRAKEQCEYLIVGVVTDEGIRRFKKTESFIPFAERLEIVKSCRYVDEAVAIPENYGSTRDAFRLYHFDCQFSGSDYVENAEWLAEKEFLEKHGAELVFFPYTESTSSTQLKKLIEEKLL